jgi:hypothetical protein
MRFRVTALIAMAVIPLSAHHPFTPYYDASKPGSVTGVIAELRSMNPHVVLIVEGKTTDSRAGRWAFEGYPPLNLVKLGYKNYKTRLRAGTKVTITGWPAKDPTARAFSARDITFTDGSTMQFGPTPEDGDRWSCVGPCQYTYPDVRAQ